MLKLSLTGIVAIRRYSAEPLVWSYGTKRAHDSRYRNLCVAQNQYQCRLAHHVRFDVECMLWKIVICEGSQLRRESNSISTKVNLNCQNQLKLQECWIRASTKRKSAFYTCSSKFTKPLTRNSFLHLQTQLIN